MKARRVAFAVPFVVTVACERPEAREPKPEIEEREDHVVVDVSPRPPPPAPVPYQLVDELKPLGPRPEPSTTPTDRFPTTVEPVTKHIREIQRGVIQSRVRIHRAPRVDGSWRVTFVTRDQRERGDCTIVEWDSRVVECTTALTPEQLVDDEGETVMARLIPPTELVTEVESAQDEWKRRPPRCCTNPPPPERWPPKGTPPDATGNPPPPMRARVLKTDVVGDRTIVTVGKGSSDGVDKNWTGHLVRDDDKTVPNGACTIIRVDKLTTVCALKMTRDQVTASPFVRLSRDR